MKLPKEYSLDLSHTRLAHGSVALADFVAASIKEQGGSVSSDELVTISSAAFSQYVYDPNYNQHLDEPPDFSWYAELFSNYGIFESIGYYTGWEVREINHISNDDFWKLIQFEISNGRPVVSIRATDLQPVLLIAYDWADGERHIKTSEGALLELGAGKMQGTDDVLENWLVFVRPGETPEWSPKPTRHQMNVLRWAAEHAHTAKEFFQDSRENYASGLTGFEAFLRLHHTLKTDPTWTEYAARHVSRLIAGRRAASHVLATWADGIATELGKPEVGPMILELSAVYGKIATALAQDDSIAIAYANAVKQEAEAAEQLAEIATFLPSAFG